MRLVPNDEDLVGVLGRDGIVEQLQEDADLGVKRTNGSAKGQVISTFTMLRNPIAARRNTLQKKYGLLGTALFWLEKQQGKHFA